MTDLIARLEAAEVGSRELDALIWLATGSRDHIAAFRLPDFSTSIDAALALASRVLPGWFWRCGRVPSAHWQGGRGVHGWAHVSRTHADHCDRKDEATGWAATPELALCAAVLRASNPKGEA